MSQPSFTGSFSNSAASTKHFPSSFHICSEDTETLTGQGVDEGGIFCISMKLKGDLSFTAEKRYSSFKQDLQGAYAKTGDKVARLWGFWNTRTQLGPFRFDRTDQVSTT